MSGSILVGAVLSFAVSDGSELNLSVALSKPAPISLRWDGKKHQSAKAEHHVFSKLPTPQRGAIEYALSVPGERPRVERVRSPFGSSVRIALYGDSRDGPGPHAALVRQIAEHEPHVLVHTGDRVYRSGDTKGWLAHLAATLPLSSRVPVVMAIGNHELAPREDGEKRDLLRAALEQVPPPLDPLAKEVGVRPSTYHVRVGSTLLVVLDSNLPYGRGTLQYRFLLRALARHPDVRWRLVALHHGPRSTARHGPHPDGDELAELLAREEATACLAGHDHVYERLIDGPVTYLVSGGGGAPLYGRGRFSSASRAFAATYNWVRLDLTAEEGTLTAYSLEGVVLDRARLPAKADPHQKARFGWPGWAVMAVVLLFVGLSLAAVRLASARDEAALGLLVLGIWSSAGCVRVAATAAQPTALERQLLGAYEELDRELIYASSIRGSNRSPVAAGAMRAQAVRARAIQRFNRDDLLELFARGCIGENRNGRVVSRPCSEVERSEEVLRRRQRVVREENAARRTIIEWAAHELARREGRTHPTREELLAVKDAYARVVQDALPPGALREVSPGRFEAH